MKEVTFFNHSNSTASYNLFGYSVVTSASPVDGEAKYSIVDNAEEISIDKHLVGKYSIYDVADWFLSKSIMTHKKLQKLCYYAQAWSLALNDYKLVNTDFQAWIHGPVSYPLYEKFKKFGYEPIEIKKM